MDPLSQGLFGGLAAQVVQSETKNKQFDHKYAHIWASLCGFYGGILPDADVFIRSSTDPLFGLMIHRHFTHALALIPVIGIIAACVMWLILRHKLTFKKILLYSTLGAATHGLIDATTSYGTHIYWPFLAERTAWSFMPIIDPIVLATLFLSFVGYMVFKHVNILWTSVLILFLYFSFAVMQHGRVEKAVMAKASERNHKVVRMHVQPTLFNTILWRGIYTTADDVVYMDGYRMNPMGDLTFYEGGALRLYDMPRGLTPEFTLYDDIKRFEFFSNGFLAVDPDDKYLLIDARYSMLPNSADALWGIRIDYKNPNDHVEHIHFERDREKLLPTFTSMLKGEDGQVETINRASEMPDSIHKDLMKRLGIDETGHIQ